MPERRFKKLLDSTSGALTVALLGAIKHTDRKRMANFAGALLRKAGPLFKEHRLGRAQLRAAFPEKSNAEIEKILGGVWNNLGRIAIEFAQDVYKRQHRHDRRRRRRRTRHRSRYRDPRRCAQDQYTLSLIHI